MLKPPGPRAGHVLINKQEKNMKRLVALMLLSLFSVAALSGCNTIAGAGKDVQKAGEKVEDAAKR